MKRHVNRVWLILVVIILSLLVIFPSLVSRESIAQILDRLGPLALVGYLMLSVFRSLLLIPSTPFILAGAVSFPEQPVLVMGISLVGIVAGAYLVYRFPSIGGYDKALESRYPEKIAMLKEKMHSKYSFWFVAGWSLFPLVPTDAVCYVAGVARMPVKKMLGALVLGEIGLVAFYVFVGVELGEWLRA